MPNRGIFSANIRGVIWTTGLNHVANLLDTEMVLECGEDLDVSVGIGTSQANFFSDLIFPWCARAVC